ncbi:MAG TPA: LysR family transcriptional regulator [Selenomonadales bacterium]|nr:LysR family transcriptional regulator [Selenomonadales bacterium]
MSHWQSLSVFISVAEEGSFSGAAKRLELTQPTISFHIDSLERKFGCPLFQRTAKGATLTVYGETLYQNTRIINSLLDETEKQIKAMLEGAAGKITFGASTIPAEYILPPIMADFLRTYPDVRLTLRTGDSQSILAAFKAGDFPLAVIGAHPGEEYAPTPLWQDELVLVAHPGFAARLSAKPTLDELLALPLVTRSLTSGSTRTVMSALSGHGIKSDDLRLVLQVGGNEALKVAIMSQAGIGFISKWAVKPELASGQLVRFETPGLSVTRQFYAISRQPLIPTCVKMFWDYIVDSAAKQD